MVTRMGETLPRWRRVLLGALMAAPVLVAPSSLQAPMPPQTSTSQTLEGLILPPSRTQAPTAPQAAVPATAVPAETPKDDRHVDMSSVFADPDAPGQDLTETLKHVRAALQRAEHAAAQERSASDLKHTVAGYDARFSLGRSHLEGTHKLESQADSDRPNLRTHFGIAAETKIAAAELAKTHTFANGFVSKHGVDGSVRARYEVGFKPVLSTSGPSTFARQHALTLDSRAEFFHTLDRDTSDTEHVHLDVYAGVYDDLIHPGLQVFVEASQELNHDIPRTVRAFGGMTLSATAREGYKNDIHFAQPWPYAEISGTVSRPVPVSLLGSQDMIVSTGIQVQRYPGTPALVRPEVNGTLRW